MVICCTGVGVIVVRTGTHFPIHLHITAASCVVSAASSTFHRCALLQLCLTGRNFRRRGAVSIHYFFRLARSFIELHSWGMQRCQTANISGQKQNLHAAMANCLAVNDKLQICCKSFFLHAGSRSSQTVILRPPFCTCVSR